MEYEASFNLHERLEVKNYFCIELSVRCDALHDALHVVHNVVCQFVCETVNVVRCFVCETVIATSSELDFGLI